MSNFLKDKPKRSIETIILIVSSLLMVCLGLAMMFTSGNWILYGTYVGGGLLIAFGTYFMIRYFLKEEFLSVSNYGFAWGLSIVVLGAICFIRADVIVAKIGLIIGFILLVYGAILLQHTFAAFHMEGKLWWLILIFSLVTIASAVLMFIDYQLFVTNRSIYFYSLLIANGLIVNISLITFASTIKKKTNATKVRINRTMEENPNDFPLSENDSVNGSNDDSSVKVEDDNAFED